MQAHELVEHCNTTQINLVLRSYQPLAYLLTYLFFKAELVPARVPDWKIGRYGKSGLVLSSTTGKVGQENACSKLIRRISSYLCKQAILLLIFAHNTASWRGLVRYRYLINIPPERWFLLELSWPLRLCFSGWCTDDWLFRWLADVALAAMENASLPNDVWNNITTSSSEGEAVPMYLTNIRDLALKVIYIIMGTVGVLDNVCRRPWQPVRHHCFCVFHQDRWQGMHTFNVAVTCEIIYYF